VLYSGPFSVRKGAHILLDAWRRLGPIRNAELHIYGTSSIPGRLLNGLDRSVIMHGNVSKSEIYQAYRDSSILVFPTLCDGFGMVVTEAFAHGLPVITTPNAGAADLISEAHNGFIVPPGDAEALAERIQWCIENESTLAAMKEDALATAKNWTWSHFRSLFREQLSSKLGYPFA
jgi:glycosyltransferase involved in cell wall biosynthesis